MKRVSVRARGLERIITPVENTWDSIFLELPSVPEDLMTTRARQEQSEHGANSSTSLAELLHGAEKCSAPAQPYGSIRASLERVGTPLGVNDLHIAAHARSEGLTLVTSNLREFERVPAPASDSPWASG